MAESVGESGIIPHDEPLSKRKKLALIRQRISADVNESFKLSLRILEEDNPHIPREVAREMLREIWSDQTLRNLDTDADSVTEIEQALLDAWQEIDELQASLEAKDLKDDHSHSIHVYGLASWGENVTIVGTRHSLLRMEQAAKEARRVGKAEYIDAQDSDGEPYKIVVIRETEEQLKKRKLPYYDVIS